MTRSVNRWIKSTAIGCERAHVTRIERLGGNAAELCRWRGLGGGQPQGSQLDPPGASHAETVQAERVAKRDLLTLKLVHLGVSVRRMRTQANPDDLDALQQLMLEAVRRGGGDRSRSGESEMNPRLSGGAETIATVVAA